MDDIIIIAETNDYYLTVKDTDGVKHYAVVNKKWEVIEGSIDQLPVAIDLLTKLQQLLLSSLSENEKDLENEQVITL